MNTSTHNNDSSKNRSRLALRGAVSAATATAVLLGGFGAFALWTDTADLGFTGNIQTGHLQIDSVTSNGWTFQGDSDENHDGVLDIGQPVNPANFRVSPGDVLQWDGTVTVLAQGDDLRGRLTVDDDSIIKGVGFDEGDVVITVAVDGNDEAEIVGTPAGTERPIPVTVTIAFNRVDFDQNAYSAVNLNGMALSLEQITG